MSADPLTKNIVYISNLPFSLKNNDLHKILATYGKILKVTVMKNRRTRKSTGVAFVNFEKIEEANVCIKSLNNIEMFGRTLKASIAKDNGRYLEFNTKKQVIDKNRCFECGECGHLSYSCPGNILGERIVPKKKDFKLKKRKSQNEDKNIEENFEDDDRRIIEFNDDQNSFIKPKPKYKKNSYLSDEEELDDNDDG